MKTAKKKVTKKCQKGYCEGVKSGFKNQNAFWLTNESLDNEGEATYFTPNALCNRRIKF